MEATILVVEDDVSLNRGLTFKLKKEGYQVLSASNLEEARSYLQSHTIDLIVSDVGLPDGSGFDFCQEVRQTSDVIFVLLTALDQEVDMVTGYELGADDYITKPFSLLILISKINALMRRNEGKSKMMVFQSKDVVFSVDEMKITKRNNEMLLSKNEHKLLKYMMNNALQVLTKEQLLQALWDHDGQFVDENTVAVNIRRLREKVEDEPSMPTYIKNVRGVGYVWSEECVKR
ncbi:response regulator transcription factor [Bacillus sp. 1P06AnD]|uniref:response regulator transcription factor n=1 Tax=Bacillus sp. 1P06AnD TaxID=3132208 RepID=UPI0039A3B72F